MPLQLLPLTPQDAPSWVRIRTLAYAGPTNTLIHTTLPVSEETFQRVSQDWAKEIGKPNSFHWKVVDTDLSPSQDDPEDNLGRTIAIAVWSAHNIETAVELNPGRKEEEEEEPPFLPPELKIDILSALLNPLRDARHEIMGSSTPYFMLNSLATHPEHYRRGCAGLLMEWGLRKADELGVDTYLDASEMGRGLYERWGFELVRGVEFDRTVWGGEGVDWHGCMIRRRNGRRG